MNNYGYNKAREQKIFESRFAKYEAMLIKEGVAKEDIKMLFDLYWNDFNADRRFRQRQYSNLEDKINLACTFDFSDFPNIDELEDERLYQYLKKDTHQMYSILIGIYRGLSIKEIAFMLDSTPMAIYKRIQRFKKAFNICPK